MIGNFNTTPKGNQIHRQNIDMPKPRLPTLCLKKVWKLCEVLNVRHTYIVRVAAGHRRAQAQEMTAGTSDSSRFWLGSQNFFAKQNKNSGILGFLLGVS